MDSTQIPLRNQQGKIISYTIIDDINDNDEIKNIKWHMSNGYVKNTKYGLLHRLIINAKDGDIVDHMDNDKLNNRKSNLRIVSIFQNAQNKNKKNGCISKYKGVSFDKKTNKWYTRFTIDYKRKSYGFDEEDHAGYWYDYNILKHYGSDAKINNIERPNNFIEPNEKMINILPKGITKKGTKFVAVLYYQNKRYHIGTFETVKEAEEAYNSQKNELIPDITTEIKRNINGIAVIYTLNNTEILVDDDKYHNLSKYKWQIINGYAFVQIQNKSVLMHRYILDPTPTDIIDHINGNRSDNRIDNLRISNHSLNNHNKKKDGYIGVRSKYNRFQSQITKDGHYYYLGSFETDKEAALAYNKKALELYGEYANLNTIDN